MVAIEGSRGFGLDFAVRIAPPASAEEASGAVGEFFRDGFANTLFWVDPANDIAAVLFIRDAVYYGIPEASAK